MIKKLASEIREYKKDTILTPVYTALEVVMEVSIPFIMAFIIDEGINKGNLSMVFRYGSLMIVMALLSLFFGFQAGRYAASASTGFAKNLRKDMFEKIQDFSFQNIDKFTTAGLVTRLTTDVTRVQNAFQMIIRIGVRPPMMIIVSVIMCFVISKSLSVIYLVAIPILAICLGFIIKFATKAFRATFEKYDALNASVQENVTGIRVVKAFVREEYENVKFMKAVDGLKDMFVKAEKIIAFNGPVMNLIANGCIIALSWFGAKQVVSGSITTGNLTSLFSYVMNILMSLMMLSMVFVMITMSMAAIQRILEVLDEVPSLSNKENPIMEVKDGSIDFNHVNFSYQ